MASAILTAFRPDLFTVLDWRAWGVLEGYGLVPVEGGSTDLDRPAAYVDYLAVCTGLARERDVSLRNLDRFLFVLGGAGCGAMSFLKNRAEEGLQAGR